MVPGWPWGGGRRINLVLLTGNRRPEQHLSPPIHYPPLHLAWLGLHTSSFGPFSRPVHACTTRTDSGILACVLADNHTQIKHLLRLQPVYAAWASLLVQKTCSYHKEEFKDLDKQVQADGCSAAAGPGCPDTGQEGRWGGCYGEALQTQRRNVQQSHPTRFPSSPPAG